MKTIRIYSTMLLLFMIGACHKDPVTPPTPPTPPPTVYYKVTATADSGVTISPNGVTKVESGKSITYAITADPSKRFKIFLNGTAATEFLTGNYSYQVGNVSSDQNVTVTSEVLTFTVTTTAGTGGTITPTTTVNYGSDLTLTITENPEYTLTSIKVNGVSVAITKPYVLKNVTSNFDVVVGFTLTQILILTNGGADKSRAWIWTHSDMYDENHVWEGSVGINQIFLTAKVYYYINGTAETIYATGVSNGLGTWSILPGSIFNSGTQTFTIVELTDKKFVFELKANYGLGVPEYNRRIYERQ